MTAATPTRQRSPGGRGAGWRRALLLVATAIALPPAPAAEGGAQAAAGTGEAEATFKVSGLGWWRNRQLLKTVGLLEPESGFGPHFDAAFLEDAVVLLQTALEDDGFLQPSGTVRLKNGDAEVGRFAWSGREVPEIPRNLSADEVVFDVEPGLRYTFRPLQFTGLAALGEAEARAYFIEEGLLLGGAGTRKFSPAILRRGVKNLQEELVRRGFADARVEVRSEKRDARSGDVAVVVAVEQGRLHRVAAVRPALEAPEDVAAELRRQAAGAAGAVFSPPWRQDFEQAVRRTLYGKGYASARVRLEDAGGPAAREGEMRHELRLSVEAGPQVRVGEVRFTGQRNTRESLLQRTTRVKPGEVFDRGEIDEDRIRLGSLGVFTSVRAGIGRAQPSVWDVTYQLTPAERLEVGLLFGYGSYERLRGGVEVVHSDPFGLAHRGRLQLIVSEKALSGDYLYTVPQVFGTGTDVSARFFGLERDEVSFQRREHGASVGMRRRVDWYDGEAALRYQFESVRADVFDPSAAIDAPTDSNVASLTLDLTRDRLDNPILPRRGMLLGLSLETAAEAIGGEVNYQRLDLRASWHRQVGREKFVHLGLRQGLVYALGGSSRADIPLARRFFSGGENTLRGYLEGRASPRNAGGIFIGAEVSTVLNAEFEQGIARNLSGVVFVDAGLTSARLTDYPGKEARISVGLGLRYATPIGPARLEYGHNVLREDGDGRGALHLSLGFPF